MSEFTQVRRLIHRGKIREAMGALKALSRGSVYYNEILQHYAQNTEIENRLRQALITHEDADAEKEDISQSLLDLIIKLEEQ